VRARPAAGWVVWWSADWGVRVGNLTSARQRRPRWAARGDVRDVECGALAEIATEVTAAGDLLQDVAVRLGAAGDLLLPVERARAVESLAVAAAKVEHVQILVGRIGFALTNPDAHAAWRDAMRAVALAEAAWLDQRPEA
jgi:hypothetical protein